jgi:PAS domain-containing protein
MRRISGRKFLGGRRARFARAKRWLLVPVLLASFGFFVWVNGHFAKRRAMAATERYARFLAPPLWNIDEAAGREYARLIASLGGYSSVRVYHSDGELFISAKAVTSESSLDKFLSSIGMIKRVPYSAPVTYRGEAIGRIEAVWIDRNIYLYLYVGVVLVLLLVLVSLANFFRAVARQRARAEQALVESRERLKTVVAGAPIILFAVNREGIFTLSEGKGLDKIDREQGELVGCSVSEVYGDDSGIREDIGRALKGETFTAVREIGGTTFETWYSPLPGPNGEIERVIGVSTDVTRLQRAMAALELRDESMREELSLARKIQRALFPERLPEIDGIELGMLFIPSGDIGGDFVDFVVFPDRRRLGVVFADITGHGVPAALLSAIFKVLIDEILHSYDQPGQCFEAGTGAIVPARWAARGAWHRRPGSWSSQSGALAGRALLGYDCVPRGG